MLYAHSYMLNSAILFRNDLAWDGESKRIIAVGDGRERYVKTHRFP